MNKIAVIIIILFTALNLHSQEKEEKSESKNEIGIELSDLINGALQLKYERMAGNHISVGLGMGYKGVEGIISLSGLDTDHVKTGDITYSGLKVIPEVRYYLNDIEQNGMDGFYFGAYLKYSNYKSDLDGTYFNDAMESFAIEFDAKINVKAIGFMVGYKLPIYKKLSIDFLIAGPGVGFYDFSFVNKKDLPDEFYEDFNSALEKYSLFDLLNGDFKFESTNKETDFSFISFRYGISLGYSF